MQVNRGAYSRASSYITATIDLNKAREAARHAAVLVTEAEQKLSTAADDLFKERGSRSELLILCQGYVVRVGTKVDINSGVVYSDWEINVAAKNQTEA